MRSYKNLAIVALAISAPLALGFYAYNYFSAQSSETLDEIALLAPGNVAGAATKLDEINVPNEIPVIPTGIVKNINKSDNQTTVTIETEVDAIAIKDFYDEYYYNQEWQRVNPTEYSIGNKTVKLEIVENIARLTISYSAVPTL